jgi:hypothetical protein
LMSTIGHTPEEIIGQWMLRIIADNGVDRYDDLHIDRIDSAWAEKNSWIEHGLKAFQIAVAARDRNSAPFTVGLGFSLNADGEENGVNFQTRAELSARLNSSPPSLYLFRRGSEPHRQNGSAGIYPLDPATLGVGGHARCFYLEFKQADEQYRSVFVEG